MHSWRQYTLSDGNIGTDIISKYGIPKGYLVSRTPKGFKMYMVFLA